MKNFKVMLLAMVAVLGLSSCLGESDPNVTNQEFVKVDNMYGSAFKSAAGYIIKPLNPMDVMTLKGPFAQIVYQYNSEEVEYPVKEVNAKILAAEDVPELYIVPQGGFEENAPMAAVMQAASTSVLFFDKDNIFLPLAFYYKASSDKTAQDAEVRSHHFELFQIENDNENSEDITLRLVHYVEDTSKDAERRNVGTLVEHVNLVPALAGRIPENLIFKFKKAGGDATLEHAPKELSSFTIKYKDLYEKYFKPQN